MSEPMIRRHGLEAFVETAGDAQTTDSAVRISVCGDLGHINLRGNMGDEGFVAAVEGVLGQALPVDPNTFSSEPHRVFWLGPDEWLIMTTAEDVAELVTRLGDAISGIHAAVNDISGGHVALLLEGRGTLELLSKGCTLDLHATVFPVGCCAQSGLAKASVLLACLDDSSTFVVVVRRSFADYLCRWLVRSGRPGSVRFQDL